MDLLLFSSSFLTFGWIARCFECHGEKRVKSVRVYLAKDEFIGVYKKTSLHFTVHTEI